VSRSPASMATRGGGVAPASVAPAGAGSTNRATAVAEERKQDSRRRIERLWQRKLVCPSRTDREAADPRASGDAIEDRCVWGGGFGARDFCSRAYPRVSSGGCRKRTECRRAHRPSSLGLEALFADACGSSRTAPTGSRNCRMKPAARSSLLSGQSRRARAQRHRAQAGAAV